MLRESDQKLRFISIKEIDICRGEKSKTGKTAVRHVY